jgi:4-amino-4-deoxy-L-arabinose transferase-like glycosyltransferase
VVLGVFVLLGVALRILVMEAQGPGFLSYTDSSWYLIAAHVNVFVWAAEVDGNPWPAGYPEFLRLVYLVDHHLSLVAIVQHALGVGTALLWFFTVRRAVSGLWALLPAAVVLFAGPQLFFEHAPMSEVLFAFLIAAATYCAVRGSDRQSLRWAFCAGIVVALSVCVRVVGLPLIPLLAVWMLFASGESSRRRWSAGLAVALGAALVLGGYLIEMKRETGFGGPTLTRAGSWDNSLEGRTETNFAARIATDLARFWSSTDRGALQGYNYATIMDQIDSPIDPNRPWPYTYLTDGPRTSALSTWYSTITLDVDEGLLERVHTYESHTRIEGPSFLLLLLLIVVGMPFARGRRMAVGVLVAGVAAVTLLAPILVQHFDARYVVPGYGPFAAAAAIGGAALWARVRRLATRSQQDRPSAERSQRDTEEPAHPASPAPTPAAG